MGRNPWEENDIELAGMRRSSGMTFGKVLSGLIAIGVLTFVGGYYVPLYRAHSTLTRDHERISSRVRELEQQLTSAQASLKALEGKLQGLENQATGLATANVKSAAEVEAVKTALTDTLDRYVKRGGVVVGKEANDVVVGVSDPLVFYPKKVEVSAQGRLLLCDIAKGSGNGLLSVRAFDSGGEPAAPLHAKFSTAWALRSARAASVAETLAEKCGVKPARLVASGVGASPGPTSSTLPPEHVEVRVLGGSAVL